MKRRVCIIHIPNVNFKYNINHIYRIYVMNKKLIWNPFINSHGQIIVRTWMLGILLLNYKYYKLLIDREYSPHVTLWYTRMQYNKNCVLSS